VGRHVRARKQPTAAELQEEEAEGTAEEEHDSEEEVFEQWSSPPPKLHLAWQLYLVSFFLLKAETVQELNRVLYLTQSGQNDCGAGAFEEFEQLWQCSVWPLTRSTGPDVVSAFVDKIGALVEWQLLPVSSRAQHAFVTLEIVWISCQLGVSMAMVDNDQ